MKTPGPESIIRAIMMVALIFSLGACANTSQGNKKTHLSVNEDSDIEHLSFPALESAYKRDSKNPSVALNYAQSLREKGRLQRAGIVLGPFIQDPAQKNADLFAEYGALQAARGNNRDAEFYARKSIALSGKNGKAYHILGIALDAQGKHDQAETAFRKALDNWQGNSSPVLNNLGLNLAAQGFMDEAVSTLQKAAKQSPDNKEIERNLRIVTALKAQSPPSKPAPAPSRKPPVRKKTS